MKIRCPNCQSLADTGTQFRARWYSLPAVREYFLRKAPSGRSAKSRGNLTIHKVGRDDDRLYIVSNYVNSVDLS